MFQWGSLAQYFFFDKNIKIKTSIPRLLCKFIFLHSQRNDVWKFMSICIIHFGSARWMERESKIIKVLSTFTRCFFREIYYFKGARSVSTMTLVVTVDVREIAKIETPSFEWQQRDACLLNEVLFVFRFCGCEILLEFALKLTMRVIKSVSRVERRPTKKKNFRKSLGLGQLSMSWVNVCCSAALETLEKTSHRRLRPHLMMRCGLTLFI